MFCHVDQHRHSAAVGKRSPLFSRSQPQDIAVEIVDDGEGPLLVVVSKRGMGTEHSSDKSAALLWAWRSLLIAVSVVVSHGLVNGAPPLSSHAPAPDPALAPRSFFLLSLLPLPCLVYPPGD